MCRLLALERWNVSKRSSKRPASNLSATLPLLLASVCAATELGHDPQAPMQLESLFRFLFWAALVFAFVMASLAQPPALPGDPGDKLLHVLAFLALAGLAAFAYPRLPLIMIFIGLAFFGAGIEAVQAIPALGREASWMDWLADLGAAAVVLLAVGAIRFLLRPAL